MCPHGLDDAINRFTSFGKHLCLGAGCGYGSRVQSDCVLCHLIEEVNGELDVDAHCIVSLALPQPEEVV